MAKFMFIYHGGSAPESEEEGKKVMAAWESWLGGIGGQGKLIDPGAPAGPSKTVSSGGVSDDGGANPASGYTLVEAASIDEAVAYAKGCPILEGGGSVEVAEALPM